MNEEVKKFAWYNQQYENHIEVLAHKANYLRYCKRNILAEDAFLLDVVFNSALVDIRAIMLERKRLKDNYTIQNSYKRGIDNKESILHKIANEIDRFLNETKIDVDEMSLHTAIKFYVDKFVAHRDSISQEEYLKIERLKDYFMVGEWSVVNLVDVIIDYDRKCKHELMVTSLCWLTGENTNNDKSSIVETDINLENAMFTALMECENAKIEKLLHLKARGIIDGKTPENVPIIREVFDKKMEMMNSHERAKFLIRIKE